MTIVFYDNRTAKFFHILLLPEQVSLIQEVIRGVAIETDGSILPATLFMFCPFYLTDITIAKEVYCSCMVFIQGELVFKFIDKDPGIMRTVALGTAVFGTTRESQ